MSLQTTVRPTRPSDHETPLLALLLAEGPVPDALAALDQAAQGAIARCIAAGDFTGKSKETALLYPPGPARRILLVGLGKPSAVTASAIRRGAAVAAKRARLCGAGTAALHLPASARGEVPPETAAKAVAEGLAFGAWHYAELKRPPEDPKPELTAVDVLAPEDTKAWTEGHALGAAIGAAQAFTRGLQVLPGNVCTPRYLAETATDLGKRHGIAVTVLDKKAIEKEAMGGLLAVAQGSAEEPRFIILEYAGAKGAPVVLVGKGVTFDTGGISIKPAASMEDMKFDMSGAAAVLGAFEFLGRAKPKVRVVGLVPAAENMPSGTALKPGDVVTSHLGKTIEVVNTDAEGRLILGDALSYARRYEPACVLDAATLTGAVVIALGHAAAAIMGTDDALVEEVRQAGERAGERVWPLPLWDDYRELIKSEIGDVKNSGGRPAGSITAGWFLREFVEGYPWAHLDIAGTAYTDRDDPAAVKGPTGMGTRLFSEFILGRRS